MLRISGVHICFFGLWRISTYHSSTTSIREKYSTQGLGAPCHVSFGFFSRFFEIRLTELLIDPQIESTIRTKVQGLHSIWNAILWIEFSIWFFIASYQDIKSTFEDLQEKQSGTLGDYSRRLQDYSRSAGVPSSVGVIQGKKAFLRTCSL
jgi:hypothetical protein